MIEKGVGGLNKQRTNFFRIKWNETLNLLYLFILFFFSLFFLLYGLDVPIVKQILLQKDETDSESSCRFL